MRLGQFFVSALFVSMVVLYPVLSLLMVPAVAFKIYSDHRIESAQKEGKSAD